MQKNDPLINYYNVGATSQSPFPVAGGAAQSSNPAEAVVQPPYQAWVNFQPSYQRGAAVLPTPNQREILTSHSTQTAKLPQQVGIDNTYSNPSTAINLSNPNYNQQNVAFQPLNSYYNNSYIRPQPYAVATQDTKPKTELETQKSGINFASIMGIILGILSVFMVVLYLMPIIAYHLGSDFEDLQKFFDKIFSSFVYSKYMLGLFYALPVLGTIFSAVGLRHLVKKEVSSKKAILGLLWNLVAIIIWGIILIYFGNLVVNVVLVLGVA